MKLRHALLTLGTAAVAALGMAGAAPAGAATTGTEHFLGLSTDPNAERGRGHHRQRPDPRAGP